MTADAQTAYEALFRWCEARNWAGHDPYDGLNSRVFQSLPKVIRTNRYARLVLIQLVKRSPVNLRGVLRVAPGHNPKGVGLFLAGMARLDAARASVDQPMQHRDLARTLVEQLATLATPGYAGACWGYNFDWQARAFFQPKGMPTVVASSFVAHALLDAAEAYGDERALDLARSTGDFIRRDLHRTTADGAPGFSFSYSPLDRTQVFNASLLGARLLARLCAATGDDTLRDDALNAARFVAHYQRADGSWGYGTAGFQTWVDNFHTGFNLECLADIDRHLGTTEFADAVERGYRYYRETLFLPDGTPKYFNTATYPVDVHASAQAVITHLALGQPDEAERAADWALRHMRDPEGFFYFQKHPRRTVKTPFMRWSQAWMFYALGSLLAARLAPVPADTGTNAPA